MFCVTLKWIKPRFWLTTFYQISANCAIRSQFLDYYFYPTTLYLKLILSTSK